MVRQLKNEKDYYKIMIENDEMIKVITNKNIQ
jgi:hypothetical protein